MLGRPTLFAPGGSALSLSSKSIALLTYLRLTANQRAHRAFLADLLWSEVDEERGRASLRQAVLSLRATVGETVLVSENQDLRLAQHIECDALEIVAWAARGDHAAVAEGYGGEFFGQFALPGARGFELWATVERERLRSIYVRSADAATQKLLDEGRAGAAAEIAERVITAEPLRERSWRLLLESRLTLGDFARAEVDAAAMRAQLASQGMQLDAATESLLRRIRLRNEAVPSRENADLRAELVGRVAPFSALVDAWKSVGAHGATIRAVTGPAGIGKSRLLDDFAERLRSLGARVVQIRALLGEHEIPFAMTAQLVTALASSPGAAGISAESAATIVALEPRLQSTFQGHKPDVAPSHDVSLRRAAALVDLIGAVSDERALAVLIDDLHWADTASVRVLAAASARLGGARVLLLTAQRHGVAASIGAVEIPLATLSVGETRELLQSLATLPDAAWAEELPHELRRLAAGTPQLIVETLRLLTQEQVLLRREGVWNADDESTLRSRLATLDVRGERLRQLDREMREILLHLSLSGCALHHRVLVASCPGFDVGSTLARLKTGGWILSADDTIGVSHDDVARSVLHVATTTETQAASRALITALRDTPKKSDAEWRLEARLLLETPDWDGLVRTLDASRLVFGDPDWSWRSALTNLLGDLASDDVLREVGRRRPVRERISPRFLRELAGLCAVCLLAIGGWHLAVTPYALRFVSAPLAASDRGLSPVPVIEIVNRLGARVAGADNRVMLHLTSSKARLVGDAATEVRNGTQTFSEGRVLNAEADTLPFVIEATSDGLVPAHTVLMRQSDAFLRLDHLSVAAGTARVAADTMYVGAGSHVAANATLVYSTGFYAASVMLAGVPTWGDAASTWLELGPMSTPARNARAFVPVRFVAPSAAGRYRLFLVMAAESDAAHIASATNWAAGAPQWNDGNDLAHWGDAEAESARRLGQVKTGTWLYRENIRSPLVSLPATVIDIVVRDAVTQPVTASRR